MNCKDCIHNEVCYRREVCNDIEEHIRKLGCMDFIARADVQGIKHGEWTKDDSEWTEVRMMIAKKALELLNDIEFAEKYQGVQEHAEMLIVCKEALEKQIPKKLKDDGWLYCPICGRDVLMDRFNYCPDCGQALDWSDTE